MGIFELIMVLVFIFNVGLVGWCLVKIDKLSKKVATLEGVVKFSDSRMGYFYIHASPNRPFQQLSISSAFCAVIDFLDIKLVENETLKAVKNPANDPQTES